MESESFLRVEALDRCLEELELVSCNCLEGGASVREAVDVAI